MSYILDALRKSDQQRQHAKAPTLLTAQSAQAEPKRTNTTLNIMLAAAMIGAGILIGWLRPWHSPEPYVAPVARDEPAASRMRSETTELPSPLPALPESNAGRDMLPSPAVESMSPTSPPAEKAVSVEAKATLLTKQVPQSVPIADQEAAKQEKHVLKQSELPVALQQTLPSIMIAFHQYDGSQSERRVMINNIVLRQGEFITPELKLEEITPDGVVLGYQGYHFARGVR